MEIHSSAQIASTAQLGEGTTVGPGAIIEDGVMIGADCRIAAYAIIRKGSQLGNSVSVDSFSVIGGDPQDIGFDPDTDTGVILGDGVRIREGCTVNRATVEGQSTILEAGVYLMAQAHVAHDCHVSANVILCNNVLLGGHVKVGERAFLGGGSGVHQFCRIGAFAMIAGNATMTADVPPYVMAAGRNEAYGLNLVGLRRGGFERNEIADLKRCYRAVYVDGGNLKLKAAQAARETEFGTTACGARFLCFFESGKRGYIKSELRKS